MVVQMLKVLRRGLMKCTLNAWVLGMDKYERCVTAVTADGASVNFGQYNGLLTKLSANREWLVKIHCGNHRTELAVKSAMDVDVMNKAEQLYLTNYFLLKNSGALLAQVESATEVLGITCYTLPKIHGTRFINHRFIGFQRFLHMIPALIMGYDNALAKGKMNAKTRAKVTGLVKQLKNAHDIVAVCAATDILEKVKPASMVFEGDDLVPHELNTNIEITITELQELLESSEIPIDSNMLFYQFQQSGDGGETKAVHQFCKRGHERKKPVNREYKEIAVSGITHYQDLLIINMHKKIKEVTESLIALLKQRFVDENSQLFALMAWFDPKSWDDSSDYGVIEIQQLYDHFKVPLDESGYDPVLVLKEWKRAKIYIKNQFNVEIEAIQIWKVLITKHSQQYPNLTKLALIISLSGSNSAVERSFSILTMILSDRRLSLQHQVMEDLMVIKCNDRNWNKEEKQNIIKKSIEIYFQKRR